MGLVMRVVVSRIDGECSRIDYVCQHPAEPEEYRRIVYRTGPGASNGTRDRSAVGCGCQPSSPGRVARYNATGEGTMRDGTWSPCSGRLFASSLGEALL